MASFRLNFGVPDWGLRLGCGYEVEAEHEVEVGSLGMNIRKRGNKYGVF